ncbi:MAG: succinate dehydrogenase, hydrophobic membrane anchor protein [Kordiimonadaceae bacterium]|nr:succinate dehydrogenase, hydrophobic membrane anchor protein [Kordiimonadaceae bacterium]MBT6035789.1 succinate dehydrogenase, hydrophobic membrane anchor protein [Kordiimonadaceae bacterium]MBT6329491.1 succinate dehydrogenase, hydrophobic membrane anchor protein [Kordiimonadaceae bacterium]MBT7581641.1 succinate dehydrogenase, hydrophobic membrane anchor protein [Kordiimonadaceae bacterium]
MSLRSPLGKVRGLGSAKNGTHHWWMQKLTAVALIPLTIWFVASVVQMTQADYEIVINWMNSPLVAVLMILFVSTGIYHLKLGLQVIIEDYIHTEGAKMALQVIVTFGCVALATTALFSILKIAL